jgi:tetratricopeptide (TPR) repeat protein
LCTISAAQSRGRHACDLCTPSTFASGERNGISLSLGSSEIRVFSPAGTIIYAAPTLIFHYVSIHHYQPPEDFLQALREGPKPPVLEYFGQLSSIDPQWNRTSTTDPVQGYLEGLRIYRELGKTNPGYLPYVADSLFELGIYDASHDREKAKQFYEEALEIYRHLAKGNSAKYLARVAKILIRLGDLYGLTQRPKKAEEAYQEALTIYRELVAGSPDYLIFVSSALNQLARLYKAAGRVRDSADASEEALKIRQEWQAAKLQIPWH